MIPEHVLRKMRAALLVAGAVGCTRAGASLDAGSAGDARGADGSATGSTDTGADDASVGDANVTDDTTSADAATDGAVVACPYHPEGHAKLEDGGLLQAAVDPGLSIVGIGVGGVRRDPCLGCGMGGARSDPGMASAQKMSGEVRVGAISGTTVAQTSVLQRLVAGMRASMKACYRVALSMNPTEEGSLTVTAAWDLGGAVKTVSTQSGGNLDAPMQNCVARRFKNIGPQPDLAGATATVRLTFVVQK